MWLLVKKNNQKYKKKTTYSNLGHNFSLIIECDLFDFYRISGYCLAMWLVVRKPGVLDKIVVLYSVAVNGPFSALDFLSGT